MKLLKIDYLFRSKELNAHSVERVFSSIIPLISNMCETEQYYMPHYRVSLKKLLSNVLTASRIAKQNSASDVFHITGDIYYVSIALPREKAVLTVLDTVSLEQTYGIKRFLLKTLWFSIPLRWCKYITVISEKTERELISLFPFCKDKLTVIPCPVDSSFTRATKEFNSEQPIVLQVGTKSNKNLNRVIQALEGIPCELRIIGKLTAEEEKKLVEKGIKYRNYVNISNAEIVEQYRKCDFVIFASTYEGFGMPIVEAQASGKPVITSNIEPMISVAGDGACLVDPYDIDSIRNGIKRIISDDHYRNQLVLLGLDNCKKYSVSNVSTQYLKMYDMVKSKQNNKKEKSTNYRNNGIR